MKNSLLSSGKRVAAHCFGNRMTSLTIQTRDMRTSQLLKYRMVHKAISSRFSTKRNTFFFFIFVSNGGKSFKNVYVLLQGHQRYQTFISIKIIITGVLRSLQPDQEGNKLQRPNSNFCKPLKKNPEFCPSNQDSAAAMTSASNEKWRPFNCFFSRVGHPCTAQARVSRIQ